MHTPHLTTENFGNTTEAGGLARSWLSSSSFCAAVSLLIGTCAALGWILDLPMLRSFLPGAVQMKFNTALALIFSSFALILLRTSATPRQVLIGRIFGALVFFVGCATLSEYLLHVNLGIDELFFRDTAVAFNLIRGRMSPFTAGIFTGLGIALYGLQHEKWRHLVRAIAIVTITIGISVCLGYLWRANELISDSWLPPVAIHTAFGFVMLGLSVLFYVWDLQRRHRSTGIEKKVITAFFGAFIVLTILGGFAYRASAIYEDSVVWVHRALQVPLSLEKIDNAVTDLELEYQFLVLKQRQVLPIKNQEKARNVQQMAQDLVVLVNNNPQQLASAKILQTLIERLQKQYKEVLSVEAKASKTRQARPIASADITLLVEEARTLIRQMNDHEIQLLKLRNVEQSKNRQHMLIAIFVALLFAVTTFIVLFLGIRKESIARTAAEAKVQDAATRMATILDTAHDGIITVDQYGKIESFNRAAELLFGFSSKEVLGQNVKILMPEPDRQLHDQYIQRFIESGEERIIGIGREVLAQKKDGSKFEMSISISEMKLGGERHFTGIVADITERKNNERNLILSKEKAEFANRTKDSFLATMSHEIRTPLTGMLGMLELLSMTSLQKEQSDTLNTAWNSATALLRIVNDILDWSKIEEGKLQLSPHPTSLRQLLNEVINTYSRVASAKGLILNLNIGANIGVAHLVDPLRLSQILNNFVSNAIKFTSVGQIDLHAELISRTAAEEKIQFSVSDTGIGIAPEAQKHLFQRYSQESADTARMYGGTGLGLEICSRLAELMQGKVALESVSGRGSVFSLQLAMPLADKPKDTMPRGFHSIVEKRLITPLFAVPDDAPLVLAIDDHPVNRDLLTKQLAMLGLRVETAEDGQAGFLLWYSGRFSVIITDCHMPEMDGYTLTREIRRIESKESRPYIPIIAWTANALPEETLRCKAAGMNELLVKPTDMTVLKSTLKRVLQMDVASQIPKIDDVIPSKAKDTPPLDFEILKSVMPEREMQYRMLLEFRTHIRYDYVSLNNWSKQGDWQNIQRTAHRMKGSSAMVGATHLVKACGAIEQMSKDKDIERAQIAITMLEEHIRELEDFFVVIGVADSLPGEASLGKEHIPDT
ncbi:MAG: PAS domain S-box protein [Undibacterium sp.]|nr:PAS domain S-box protein [Undibacterium sp.]